MGAVGFTAAGLGSVSRWCLSGVSVVSVVSWCFGGASMMSRWCLGGVLAASMLIQGVHGCSRCFGRILVVSRWSCEKCNVVWYPITSIDQSPWSLSFAGHFCWALIPHCQPFGGPSGKSKIHSTMATSDSRIATRCRGPQISNGPSLIKTTWKTPMVPGSLDDAA